MHFLTNLPKEIFKLIGYPAGTTKITFWTLLVTSTPMWLNCNSMSVLRYWESIFEIQTFQTEFQIDQDIRPDLKNKGFPFMVTNFSVRTTKGGSKLPDIRPIPSVLIYPIDILFEYFLCWFVGRIYMYRYRYVFYSHILGILILLLNPPYVL